jgi:hypothetical protein
MAKLDLTAYLSESGGSPALSWLSYRARWQCAQVPVISTTESFGANPVARTAELRLCATTAAGISPT